MQKKRRQAHKWIYHELSKSRGKKPAKDAGSGYKRKKKCAKKSSPNCFYHESLGDGHTQKEEKPNSAFATNFLREVRF